MRRSVEAADPRGAATSTRATPRCRGGWPASARRAAARAASTTSRRCSPRSASGMRGSAGSGRRWCWRSRRRCRRSSRRRGSCGCCATTGSFGSRVYRDYQRSVGSQLLQLVTSQPQLEAIRRLEGPAPATLQRCARALSGGAERLHAAAGAGRSAQRARPAGQRLAICRKRGRGCASTPSPPATSPPRARRRRPPPARC